MDWLALVISSSLVVGMDSPATLEGHVTLVSDYRSRGLSSSEEGLALQAGLGMAQQNGAYWGAWASSLEPSGDARSEINLFAGLTRPLAGFDIDVSVTAFAFPGQEDTAYGELVLAASRAFGPMTKTLGLAYAPEQAHLDASNHYWFAETEAPLGATGLNLIGALGVEEGPLGDLAGDGGEKWDWTLGISGPLEHFSWSLAYMDSTEDTDLSDAQLVFSLERGF